MTIICCLCKEEVQPKCNHFKVIEMDKFKEIEINYMHKVCWDSHKRRLDSAAQSLEKSNYLLNAMGKFMKDNKIIKEEAIYEIK